MGLEREWGGGRGGGGRGERGRGRGRGMGTDRGGCGLVTAAGRALQSEGQVWPLTVARDGGPWSVDSRALRGPCDPVRKSTPTFRVTRGRRHWLHLRASRCGPCPQSPPGLGRWPAPWGAVHTHGRPTQSVGAGEGQGTAPAPAEGRQLPHSLQRPRCRATGGLPTWASRPRGGCPSQVHWGRTLAQRLAVPCWGGGGLGGGGGTVHPEAPPRVLGGHAPPGPEPRTLPQRLPSGPGQLPSVVSRAPQAEWPWAGPRSRCQVREKRPRLRGPRAGRPRGPAPGVTPCAPCSSGAGGEGRDSPLGPVTAPRWGAPRKETKLQRGQRARERRTPREAPRPQMPHSFARWSQLCTLVWAHPGGPLSLAPSPALGGGPSGSLVGSWPRVDKRLWR